MAKQTELSNLLKSLHRAIYAHVDLSRTPHVTVTDVRLKHTEEEVDKATKRLFSYFDKMQEQIDTGERDKTALRDLLIHAQDTSKRHGECVQAAGKVGVTFRQEKSPGGTFSWYVAELPGSASTVVAPFVVKFPFDLQKVKDGAPIQCEVAKGHEGSKLWFDARFIGMSGDDVVIDSDLRGLEKVVTSDLRMKMKAPSELTLYANVARNQGLDGIKGAVYATYTEANTAAAKFPGQHVVTAFPVKVTVTL